MPAPATTSGANDSVTTLSAARAEQEKLMKMPVSAWVLLGFGLAFLSACSKPEAPAAAPPVAAAPAAKPVAEPTACSMVTQEQMSEILGMTVIGVPDESSSGVTKCVYTASKSLSPDASIEVEWGEGQAAMMGVGIANQAEPGITDPLDGLGDEAAQVGPVLFVRSGDDLVKIYLTGLTDVVPAARKVLALVQAKL
jgi:hypothetical protein